MCNILTIEIRSDPPLNPHIFSRFVWDKKVTGSAQICEGEAMINDFVTVFFPSFWIWKEVGCIVGAIRSQSENLLNYLIQNWGTKSLQHYLTLLSFIYSKKSFQEAVPEFPKEQESKGVLKSCCLSTNLPRCLGVFSGFRAVQELESQSPTPIHWRNSRKLSSLKGTLHRNSYTWRDCRLYIVLLFLTFSFKMKIQ